MNEEKFKITMSKSKATAPLAEDYDNANYAAAAFYKLDPASRVTVTRNGEEILATRLGSYSRNKSSLHVLGILVAVALLFSAYTVHNYHTSEDAWMFYVSLVSIFASAFYAIFFNIWGSAP